MQANRISDTFRGQCVFMTGATGFMGKVFLERLLRVTEVRKIFVLIRTKRGKNADDRLADILKNPLFDKLKASRPLAQILERVQVVSGDCSFKRLNLSADDHAAITRSVSMIFHFAATVKFTEKFKRAIELNVRGTREMIQLALECEHLQVFCHISTAYSHLSEKVLLEKAYEPPADPHKMIEVAESFDEEKVEQLLSSYLCEHVPNSYVFTKALSEALVAKAHKQFNLPAIICRPAIILAAYKDPLPGWTDNLYNITGILSAGGLGILRSFCAKDDSEVNITCVDYTINNVMSSTWHYLHERMSSLYVVNLEYITLSLIGSFRKSIYVSRGEMPFDFVMWYPNVHFTESKFIHLSNVVLFQWIPSLLLDLLLMAVGRKPVLIKAQKKMFKELEVISVFANNKWVFDQTNMEQINKLLTEQEFEAFGTRERDPDKFHVNNCHGARKFIFKQSDDGIKRARKRIRVIYVLDRVFKLAFFIGVVYYLLSRF